MNNSGEIMAKKRTARRKSSSKSPLSRNITILVTLSVLVLAVIYAFTGEDYLDLFDETSPVTPTEIVQTGGSGEWWTVYFTNPPQTSKITNKDILTGSVAEELVNLINEAQQTIHIASFEFNLTPIAKALIAAHERGVEVQWVTDDEYGLDADEDEGHGQFAMMEEAGIEIVDDGRGALMHNKFWIFDGHVVWTGSTNFTKNGNFRNNNNVIILESRRIGEMYEREFAEMFVDGEFGPRSPSTVELQSTSVNGSPVEVLFAAEDEVISRLIPLIGSANKNIRFMAFAFTHDELGAAVLDRANAGVDVMGIFEKRASETEYSELPNFYCNGLGVRQDGNPGTFHHKVFIVDDEIVITGSLNFSYNADDSNDENVVIIRNTELAAQYLQEFDRRWAEAEDPDPADIGCK
jgi:phosphatidylserine/phosphatidylglycerophosphate/cardiolipin synthase-like enzyme